MPRKKGKKSSKKKHSSPQTTSTPPSDLFDYVASMSTCYMDGIGTFLLYKALNRHYCLIFVKPNTVNPKVFDSNFFYHCGDDVMRFIPIDFTTLLVQFYGDYPLVIISSKDSWESISEERKPSSLFMSYLNLEARSYPSILKELRLKDGKDAVLVCCDGGEIPVHSSILGSKWPYFAAHVTIGTNTTLNLNYPMSWVEALVSYFYDERKPLDLETAAGVLVVAKTFELANLVSTATKAIFAAEMNHIEALATWRTVRLYSETVAVYCVTRIKTPSESEEYRQQFTAFFTSASDEEKKCFTRQLCPQVNVPRIEVEE